LIIEVKHCKLPFPILFESLSVPTTTIMSNESDEKRKDNDVFIAVE
jgi:hypothetical protein